MLILRTQKSFIQLPPQEAAQEEAAAGEVEVKVVKGNYLKSKPNEDGVSANTGKVSEAASQAVGNQKKVR